MYLVPYNLCGQIVLIYFLSDLIDVSTAATLLEGKDAEDRVKEYRQVKTSFKLQPELLQRITSLPAASSSNQNTSLSTLLSSEKVPANDAELVCSKPLLVC